MILAVGHLIEDVVVWLPGSVALGSDTEVTITVRNAAGKVHTYTPTATLSAPL